MKRNHGKSIRNPSSPLQDESSTSKRRRAVRSIPTQGIKTFALNHLPSGHPLREVIMADRDTLGPEEFLAKMDVWLVLLMRQETGDG